MIRPLPWIAAAAATLGACSKPVPIPVHDLQVPVPQQWHAAETTAATDSANWWEYFGDPGLNAAIEQALRCSDDLQAAAARIRMATQERVVAGAADRPELSLGINRLRQRQNFVGLPFPGFADRVLSNTFSNAGLSFNVAWEADIWNRIAADKLAAEANIRMREAELAGARLSLSAQVAKAWFAAVEAQRQIAIAEQVLDNFETIAAWRQARFRAGSGSPMEVRLAEADVARAQTTLSQRRQARDAFVRQTEMLTCQYPAGEHSIAADLAALPEQVPAGLPSELVSRRPDLIAAEQALLAADARIVQARATLRPSFVLTSALGTSSNTLADLVNPGLQVWNYALGLTQPIFNRGRLKANVRATHERAAEQESLYQARIWTAYKEIETTLAAEQALRDQEASLRVSQAKTGMAIKLAEQRYRAALGDIFSVLNLRRAALENESVMLGLRRTQIDNRVDLHMALGGGFEASPAMAGPTAAQQTP